MKLLYRVLKVWATSSLLALAIAFFWAAFHIDTAQQSAACVFIGSFLLFATIPLLPWLVAAPWYFAQYWRHPQ